MLHEFFDSPFPLANPNLTVVLNGDSRTVVSAVFETSQAFKKELGGRTKTNVTNDTTHVERSIAWGQHEVQGNVVSTRTAGKGIGRGGKLCVNVVERQDESLDEFGLLNSCGNGQSTKTFFSRDVHEISDHK